MNTKTMKILLAIFLTLFTILSHGQSCTNLELTNKDGTSFVTTVAEVPIVYKDFPTSGSKLMKSGFEVLHYAQETVQQVSALSNGSLLLFRQYQSGDTVAINGSYVTSIAPHVADTAATRVIMDGISATLILDHPYDTVSQEFIKCVSSGGSSLEGVGQGYLTSHWGFDAALDSVINNNEVTTLIVNSNVVISDTNYIIPSSVDVLVVNGGNLNIGSDDSLMIFSHFEVHGDSYVFTGSGSAIFGYYSVPRLNAAWWGADGSDGITGGYDDDNLQKAADALIKSQVPVLFIPAGFYRLQRGVLFRKDFNNDQNGEFMMIEVEGINYAYEQDGTQNGHSTTLYVEDGSDFGFAFQQCTGVRIRNMIFTGRATHIAGFSLKQIVENTDSQWAGSTRDNRWSPHAGIVIDPFGDGTLATGSRYPNWQSYYGEVGTGGSTDILIENVISQFFMVGIAISPNQNTAQCEILNFRNIQTRYNKVGVAVGTGQARNIEIETHVSSWNQVVYDGVSYGKLNGTTPAISNLNCSFVKQIFDMNWDGTLIQNSHLEVFYDIGKIGTNVTFINNQFDLSIPDVYGIMNNPTHYEGLGRSVFIGCFIDIGYSQDKNPINIAGTDLEFRGCAFSDIPFVTGNVTFDNCNRNQSLDLSVPVLRWGKPQPTGAFLDSDNAHNEGDSEITKIDGPDFNFIEIGTYSVTINTDGTGYFTGADTTTISTLRPLWAPDNESSPGVHPSFGTVKEIIGDSVDLMGIADGYTTGSYRLQQRFVGFYMGPAFGNTTVSSNVISGINYSRNEPRLGDYLFCESFPDGGAVIMAKDAMNNTLTLSKDAIETSEQVLIHRGKFHRTGRSSERPSGGYWVKGDYILNDLSKQDSISAWVCVKSGASTVTGLRPRFSEIRRAVVSDGSVYGSLTFSGTDSVHTVQLAVNNVSSIGGMQFWFDPSLEDYTNGARADTLIDRTGNNRFALATAPGSIFGPAYRTNEVNGLSTVEIRGFNSSYYLVQNYDTDLSDMNMTYFVVIKDLTNEANDNILGHHSNINDEIFRFAKISPDSAWYWRFGAAAEEMFEMPNSGYHIMEIQHEGTIVRGRLDGGSFHTFVEAESQAYNGPLSIGGIPGFPANIHVGDMMFFNRSLSGEESQQVGEYLQLKYDLTGSYSFTPDFFDTIYYVTATVTGESGTPSSDSRIVYIANKTNEDFEIRLSEPPGVGNSITVDYLIKR